MFVLNGTYGEAKVFATTVEEEAREQIVTLLNQPFAKGSKVAIMPDCHAGKGCTIGFTQTITDKICPSLIGVDISCGMLCVTLGKKRIDLPRFDEIVHRVVPCGENVHENPTASEEFFDTLACGKSLRNRERLVRSLGTLGGGNHFIELDRDDDGVNYLVIHTGSRNLGTQVADYYQDIAIRECNFHDSEFAIEQKNLINTLKREGRQKEIQSALAELKARYAESTHDVPDELAYLMGRNKEDYLFDADKCARFAHSNRLTIADNILREYFGRGVESFIYFETVHNYVDTLNMIVRKGAISLEKGEVAIIPINMRDGSLIVVGKGNADYNCSGPHGAGRLMSRNKARATLDLEEFRRTMEGIYTTCVGETTIDEAPMAYKGMDEILENIDATAEVIRIIKPIYNFKAM